MPPAVRRASLADALAAFAAQTDVVHGVGEVTADLGAPSLLPGWTVRDTLAHLMLATLTAGRCSAVSAPGRPCRWPPMWPAYRDSDARDRRSPGRCPRRPAPPAGGRCRTAVVGRETWPATLVMWDDPLAAADAVVTRVLEFVVHGLDLGIEPDRSALGVTVRALTGVLATRHPGRAVELRVAPYRRGAGARWHRPPAGHAHCRGQLRSAALGAAGDRSAELERRPTDAGAADRPG